MSAQNHITACGDCDLLIEQKHVNAGFNQICPRCKAVIVKGKADSINRTIALSITGLILYIPANFMPVMTLSILGQSNANTMINGAVQLFKGGYWWMSFLVLFSSMAAPLALLLVLAGTSLLAKLNRYPHALREMLKLSHHLKEWAMLDVYMLGILVAFIKMKDMGYLVTGPGMYCFVALLITAIWASFTYDDHLIWENLERNQHG
jgi:paraquat-inducible protein A